MARNEHNFFRGRFTIADEGEDSLERLNVSKKETLPGCGRNSKDRTLVGAGPPRDTKQQEIVRKRLTVCVEETVDRRFGFRL